MTAEAPVRFRARQPAWQLLPMRFDRLDQRRVVVTNLLGEHLVMTDASFKELVEGQLTDSTLLRELRGKHLIRDPDDDLPVELLAMKSATRLRHLSSLTSLHIFVVSLRCEHACRYCQVSRQNSRDDRFDMTPETARQALNVAFGSPSPAIKIEFQGGEPLLNFEMVRLIVDEAQRLNDRARKALSFVIATNLALLDDPVLEFCREHSVYLSTSLDGPADLHNANRPRPGGDSWQRTVQGIRAAREALGPHSVSALMTTTEASLDRVEEIIDVYAGLDFHETFLRPLSPYGFAMRTGAHAAYDIDRWLSFYERGLDYIINLNKSGFAMVERYAAIILRKLLTNDDPRYVDLTSPAGIGIGALVYNYDGDIYASDEGRMLAEMGDRTFRLGNVHEDDYASVMTSSALVDALDESLALSSPMCSDCAYEPLCGADPVFHHATMGDVVGHKATSGFCQRNMGIFRMLIDRYEADRATRELFRYWANA